MTSANHSSLVRRGFLAITVAGLLWGTTGMVLQFVRRSSELSPVSVCFYRMAIAALVLLVATRRQLGPVLTAARSQPWRIVVVGLGVSAFQALYFVAVAWGGVAVATVVGLGVPPVALAGWEAIRARRLPPRATLCGVLAAVAGLALVSGLGASPAGTAPRPFLGVAAAVGGGLAFAITSVLSRRVMREIDSMLLTTASTAIAAVTLLPVALLSGGFAVPTGFATDGMLLYMGVFATALAYVLYNGGLRTTTGSTAAVLTLAEPLAATLLAVAVLGERLSPASMAGVLLLLGAVALAHLFPAPEPVG
ncbi:EamA family transporter [Actinoplanes sp. TBRC 11911]|uniref:DMT family transporter n=1 Tax=Actinoplanes sp. TBRC 11911 TaxID=2729386 RepID=UPI00145DEA38|nr:EamA family transporter [Actinoplanes sp. TBRC 11911]NMO51747.1 EamA family transporter [Actinoplanes sp. TBRC 11911]